MVAGEQCYVEGAQGDWFPRRDDGQLVVGEPAAAADVCRRRAADQFRAGARRHRSGVHGMVEVGVHR
ncbi:hypothetical protein B5P44_10190 [Mycobacterium sp. CBMA 213]|nr:hypothetical protein [Mycolicibacterium sp. CBMA 213]